MTEKPKIPAYLSKDARAWWVRLSSEYEDLDDAPSELLLEALCSSFDRWQSARKIITNKGVAILDRFGQVRTNPACAIERDSKATMISALRALHLDLEPLNDVVGRPPGSKK